MSDDKTVRMVTNLDRKAIEGKLADVRKAAQAANLDELATMFRGVDGMPKAQIETRVKNALTHSHEWPIRRPQQTTRIGVDQRVVERTNVQVGRPRR